MKKIIYTKLTVEIVANVGRYKKRNELNLHCVIYMERVMVMNRISIKRKSLTIFVQFKNWIMYFFVLMEFTLYKTTNRKIDQC